MAPRGFKGYALLLSAVIACPCHLPLIAALLAGTALGGFLTAHLGLVLVALVTYFVLALVLGMRWITSSSATSRTSTACEFALRREAGQQPETPASPMRVGEPT